MPPSWEYLKNVNDLKRASQALARKECLDVVLNSVNNKIPTIVAGTANLNRIQRDFEGNNEFANLMRQTKSAGLEEVSRILGENVITWKAWPGYSGRKYKMYF